MNRDTRWYTLPALLTLLVPIGVGGCLEPAAERAERDRRIGDATTESAQLQVVDGLASVQEATDGDIDLWAQAPAFDVVLESATEAPRRWEISIANAMPEAELTAEGDDSEQVEVVDRRQPEETTVSWSVDVEPGHTVELHVAPPDADEREAYRFALLSDIQGDIGRVGDIWSRMNEDDSLRFVVSTGDLVQDGSRRQLVNFRRSLDGLNIPFYSTIGNHELGEAADWAFHDLFGRVNFHYEFKNTAFTYLDSASATVDPLAYDWLSQWLDESQDQPHVFITHIPPIDPIGTRNGSFRSRNEAQKLLDMLTKGDVDLALYGHLHSYYAESQADIPIFVSGGGGAVPEHFDGIDRHYLTIDVDEDEIHQVGLVRIDEE